MGQAAPDENKINSDNKKTVVAKDTTWDRFQSTLWIYYYAQWFWIGVFGFTIYYCSRFDYPIQKLWLVLSLEPVTRANEYTISADYLVILLLLMPLLMLVFTRVLKKIIKNPTFNLNLYNGLSILRILWFALAGHLAGYWLGGLFLLSILYLNFTLRKT